MVTQKKSDGTSALTREVKELRSSVEVLHRTFKLNSQFRRSLSRSFLAGVVSAIGAMVAVVIVTPLIVWTVQRIAWPPIIADLVAEVILRYEHMNPPTPRGADGQ